MKDSDIPEISSAWWKKNQPVTLPATGLGEALRAYEAARKLAQPVAKAGEMTERLKSYDTALEALDALTPAVAKAQGKCNKTLHATCLKVLTKYPNVIVKEHQLVKKERDALVSARDKAIETVKGNGQRIVSELLQNVKALEKQLGELEDIVSDAESAESDVASAVHAGEPNAGELEVTILEAHVKDGTRLAKALIAGADKAEKTALSEWKRDFDPSLKAIDRQLGMLADRCDVHFENFEVIRTKVAKAMKQIQASAKAVRDMADGQGDVEGQYLKSFLALETRAGKVMGVLRSAFAEAGGQFDRAAFNAMNFRDKSHKDFGNRVVLDEAKVSIQRGITALNLGKSELAKARTGFDRTMKDLPGFAVRTNVKFRDVLDALHNVDTTYGDMAKEQSKLAVQANKAGEAYKKAL